MLTPKSLAPRWGFQFLQHQAVSLLGVQLIFMNDVLSISLQSLFFCIYSISMQDLLAVTLNALRGTGFLGAFFSVHIPNFSVEYRERVNREGHRKC